MENGHDALRIGDYTQVQALGFLDAIRRNDAARKADHLRYTRLAVNGDADKFRAALKELEDGKSSR